MPFNSRTIVANLPRPPTREQRLAAKESQMGPWEVARSLTLMQWAYLFVGMGSWTVDAIDFFSVSLTLTRLGEQFEKEPHDISLAITLTLLFRSLGAFVFGLLGDRYGRRWPLTVNLIIVALLSMGTGFCDTYKSFLAVRSLFGIGMGGIWGLSSATALENAPVGARGILSGVMQEGYALGYLVAAAINLTAVPQHDDWRVIFWIAAGISLFMAICRAILPESEVFIRARQHAKDNPDPEGRGPTRVYLESLRDALKLHWATFLYACLSMTCFNFLSHGSQDVYPTYAQVTKGQTSHDATVLTIIGNVGAIIGGAFAGGLSQYLGRRLTIILCCIWTGAFIPLWILPSSFSGLAAGAFFLQVGVQGAWGVVPVWLSEISPPAFRAIFAGLAYQIGNMVSASSAQIETTSGDNHKVLVNGRLQPDYAFVQAVLIGVVAGALAILMLFGPEKRGRHFEEEKIATERGAGDDRHAVHSQQRVADDIESGATAPTGGEKAGGLTDEKSDGISEVEHREKA